MLPWKEAYMKSNNKNNFSNKNVQALLSSDDSERHPEFLWYGNIFT